MTHHASFCLHIVAICATIGGMLTVTERFTRWLALSGLTQADVAKELGHHRSFITRIKTGQKRPTLNDAVRLEMLCGIPAVAWATPVRAKISASSKVRGRKTRVA